MVTDKWLRWLSAVRPICFVLTHYHIYQCFYVLYAVTVCFTSYYQYQIDYWWCGQYGNCSQVAEDHNCCADQPSQWLFWHNATTNHDTNRMDITSRVIVSKLPFSSLIDCCFVGNKLWYMSWAILSQQGRCSLNTVGTKWNCQLFLWLERESLSPLPLSLSLSGEISSASWIEYLALPRHLCSPMALHCCEGIMSTLGKSVPRALVSAHCKLFKAVKSKWFVETLVAV